MQPNELIKDILSRNAAILTDTHVVYAAGAYVNKDAVFPHTNDVAQIGSLMARTAKERAQGRFMKIDAIVGPVVGGAILSQWVTYFINQSTGSNTLALYADKELRPKDGNKPGEWEESFVLKRGYAGLVNGKKVFVVEDVLTTGGSVKKVVEVVRAAGGEVLGVIAICNRGNVTKEMVGDVPSLDSLLNLTLDKWPEADCPLCRAEVPINITVGKGKEFLKRLAAAQIG